MSENNRDSVLNRRSFLASAATATAVGSMTFAGIAGAKGSRVYTVTGSKNDPVTADQILEANQAAVDDFADRNGQVVDFADAVPGEFDGTVVDYVAAVDGDGNLRHYGGIVGEEAGEQRIHARAQKRAREFAQAADTQTVSTQASWNLYDHGEWDFDDCPYGIVTNNWDLYKLSDDGDSYEDAWAIDHLQAMDPGTRACTDSSWYGNKLYPRHRWDQNEVSSMELDDWDPNTDLSGSTTVNVNLGTGGVTLGWSFDIPDVSMDDMTSPIDDYAGWDVTLNDMALEDELITIEPGSSVWTNQNPSGKIIELKGFCQFHEHTWCCTNYHDTKPTWLIYV